jgi:hypothetical protein
MYLCAHRNRGTYSPISLAGESPAVNAQYRVCFVWTELGPAEVQIVDYHS